MDPWLLQALADMTPEEFAEALRTGQFTPQKRLPWPVLEGQVIPSAPKPVRPGLPAGAPALPSGAPQLGPGLPGLPAGGPQGALPRGAIPQPTGAFAGAPPAAPQYPPISLSSIREGAAVGAEQFGNMDTAVRSQPVPGSPQFAEAATRVQSPGLRVPLPRNGAQPFPAASPSMTDPGLSAVRPKPFGLEDLISSDRPVPGAGAPAPAAPLRSLPIPELPGEPLPAPRGAPIAAAGAPVSPPPPPSAGASPGAGIPGGQRLSQADEAMLRMRAAAAESAQFAAKEPGLLARGAGAVGRGLSRVAPPLTAAYVAGNAAKGGMDAYDPQASALANVGNVAGGAASAGGGAAWAVRPTPMNILFGGGLAEMDDPNFKLGGIAGAAKGLYDWATAPKQGASNQFTEAQPGTSAAIRAAMSGGQSRPQDFDMDADGSPPGQSMAQEKAEYSSAPAPVRPKTNGAARSGAARPGGDKGTGAPAIPPSPETGVSGGSSGPDTGRYKLLGQDLQLLDTGSGISAVRPGGPSTQPSPTPTGSWRDKGYTAMLNDKRGVVGEGRRLPLGAGPGEGARHLLAGEGNTPPAPLSLGQPQVPDTSSFAVRPTPQYSDPKAGMPLGSTETPEEWDARMQREKAARATIPKHFAGRAPLLR